MCRRTGHSAGQEAAHLDIRKAPAPCPAWSRSDNESGLAARLQQRLHRVSKAQNSPSRSALSWPLQAILCSCPMFLPTEAPIQSSNGICDLSLRTCFQNHVEWGLRGSAYAREASLTDDLSQFFLPGLRVRWMSLAPGCGGFCTAPIRRPCAPEQVSRHCRDLQEFGQQKN